MLDVVAVQSTVIFIFNQRGLRWFGHAVGHSEDELIRDPLLLHRFVAKASWKQTKDVGHDQKPLAGPSSPGYLYPLGDAGSSHVPSPTAQKLMTDAKLYTYFPLSI